VFAGDTSGIPNENQSPKHAIPGDWELEKIIKRAFLIKNL
jgi:hypothetical protein